MILDVLDNIKGADTAAKNVITVSVNLYFKWAPMAGSAKLNKHFYHFLKYLVYIIVTLKKPR